MLVGRYWAREVFSNWGRPLRVSFVSDQKRNRLESVENVLGNKRIRCLPVIETFVDPFWRVDWNDSLRHGAGYSALECTRVCLRFHRRRSNRWFCNFPCSWSGLLLPFAYRYVDCWMLMELFANLYLKVIFHPQTFLFASVFFFSFLKVITKIVVAFCSKLSPFYTFASINFTFSNTLLNLKFYLQHFLYLIKLLLIHLWPPWLGTKVIPLTDDFDS